MEFTRAKVATGVPFHPSITTSQSWWMLETLRSSTLCLRMPHRLPLPSTSLARQWLSWRCVWGRYHVGILPCGPVSKGRQPFLLDQFDAMCGVWSKHWQADPQCWQHSYVYFPNTTLDMTLSMCTQLLWLTMVRPVLSGTCPVKPLYGLGHHAVAQFQGLDNLLIVYASLCRATIIFFRYSESPLPWGAMLNFQL